MASLEAFARTLSRGGGFRLARYAPQPWAQPTQCFANARRQATELGGRAVFGWMFHHRLVSNISDAGYLVAVHHAVWRTPGREPQLVDVTPFNEDPRHRPIAPDGDVLFLVDAQAQPLVARRLVGPRPSRFHPLSDDPRLAALVADLQAAETAACRALYGDAIKV
jgi:hypothetical protein